MRHRRFGCILAGFCGHINSPLLCSCSGDGDSEIEEKIAVCIPDSVHCSAAPVLRSSRIARRRHGDSDRCWSSDLAAKAVIIIIRVEQNIFHCLPVLSRYLPSNPVSQLIFDDNLRQPEVT